MANIIPEPVTVTSVYWRDLETGANTPVRTVDGYELPFELPYTFWGDASEFSRLYLLDDISATGRELIITAKYETWPIETEIRPVPYVPEINVNPVPRTSIADQLLRHPFLRQADTTNVLSIQPGRWQVDSDIVIPPGFTLSAEPGTQLEFAPEAALISYGALNLVGSESNPVTFGAIGSGHWPGIAVLRAGGKSILRQVDIENTRGISRDAWQLTGGVTFYHSDVDFEDVSIRRHEGEDALNIVRSQFDISKLMITDTLSDAFDAGFHHWRNSGF